MSSFNDFLKSHFDKKLKAQAARKKQANTASAETAAFEQDFDKKTRDTITPVFEKIINGLLKPLKYPAEIFTAPPRTASTSAGEKYIGLHSSNDPSHVSEIRNDPMFRLSFSARHGKVEVYSSRKGLVDPKPLQEKVTIDKITPEYVEKIAKGFVEGAFPDSV